MRILIAIAAAVLYVASAKADITPPDPDMELDSIPAGTPGVGSVFSFQANDTGGGQITEKNTSTFDWIGLVITVPNYGGGPFTCHQGNVFANCTSKLMGGTDLVITYSGVGDIEGKEGKVPNPFEDTVDDDDDFFPGIAIGQDFTFTLGFPGTPNVGGWTPKQTFNAAAVSNVPEPASLALLAGVVFLLAGRDLRMRHRR